jgi:hypothetical protein
MGPKFIPNPADNEKNRHNEDVTLKKTEIVITQEFYNKQIEFTEKQIEFLANQKILIDDQKITTKNENQYYIDQIELIMDQRRYSKVIRRSSFLTMIATMIMAAAIIVQCFIMNHEKKTIIMQEPISKSIPK